MRISYKEFLEINLLAGYSECETVEEAKEEYDAYLDGAYDLPLDGYSRLLSGSDIFYKFMCLLSDAESRLTKMTLLQEAIDL